jgi:sodium/proline symporter
VPRRLRRKSEEQGAETVPAFLGGKGANSFLPRSLAAIVTVLFLGTYAAAQLNAGSKALHVLFGWEYWSGAVVGAFIVLIYCYAGGIRASIWTDVAQSCLMLGAISMMVGIGVVAIGGFGALWARLEAIDPALISFTPRSARFGLVPYALGWFGAGFGVVGQPHIMVRAMAARESRDISLARHIYFVWYVMFAAACIGAALCCRVLLPADGSFDSELALPALAMALLPPALVGVVIAGLFSATMSTADSQVLVCAAALTQDLFPGWRRSYLVAKVGTVAVTAVALGIAVSGGESVFSLVTMAWSTLAASLGPLMIVRAMGWPAGPRLASAMIVGGVAAAFVWRFTLGFGDDVFEALPGMVFGLGVYWVGRRLGGRLEGRGS